MTEQLRQSLSAVIDGEADAFELRRVLDELERDPELRSTWDRYHLIGSVMRGERTLQSRAAAHALAHRVPQAVRASSAEQDAAPGALTAGGAGAPAVRSGRGRRNAGLALAASVALAAVVVFVGSESGTVPGEPLVAHEATASPDRQLVVSAPVVQPDAAGLQVRAERPLAADAETAGPDVPGGAYGAVQASASDLRRAHAYMLQHAQQRGLEQTGVISLVKMATYEAP